MSAVLPIGFGSPIHEKFVRLAELAYRRVVKRGLPISVCRIRIRTQIKQMTHERDVPVVRRPMQKRASLRITLVHVHGGGNSASAATSRALFAIGPKR